MTNHEHHDCGGGTERSEPSPSLGNRIFQHPRLRGFFRFFTWWLVFAGIYGSSSVCPFCGQPGCPVGGLSAGVVGGFFALAVTKGKAWLQQLAGSWALLRSRLRFPPQA